MNAEVKDVVNFHTIVSSTFALLSILIIIGFVFFDSKFAFGILAGGCIAIANFFWLNSILKRVLGLDLLSPTRFTTIRFILRFSLTAFALYYLLVNSSVSITGLFIGLSVIVITFITSILVRLVRSGG